MRNKKRKGLYLILVIFLAVFLPLSIYYLYTPIDLTNYKNLLLPNIEEAAHLNIELENLGLTILPYPRLSFRGLIIREDEYIILKAESVKASLALIPLIFHKEFEVKNLLIAGSEVFIKREADGGLNIIRILKETYIPVSIKKVRIKTGRAYFTDELKILPSAQVSFSGEMKNSIRDFEGTAQIDFPDFITFANLKFESRKKNNNDRLVLNLNTTRIPLVSIKEQFFTSLLPDSFRKELNLASFRRGHIKISNLHFEGNVMDIKRPDYYRTPGSLLASIEIDDAEFTHKDFSAVFSMVDGSIKWKDGNLGLQEVTGKYGKTVVKKLEGTIEDIPGAPFMRLNGYCLVDAGEAADELKKWLGKSSSFIPLWRGTVGGLAADGIVPLSFRLYGSFNGETGKGLDLSISANAASASLGYSSWIKKEKGFKTTVDANLVIKHDSVSIKTARVNFGSSEFGIKGLLNFNQDMSYKFNLAASAIRLDDIDAIVPYLKKDFASKGSLSANLDMIKEEMQKFPKIKGAVSLRGGEFEARFLPRRVSDVNLTASFYGDSAAITVDSIKTGGSVLSGSIDIPDIKTANINFNLNSPYLDDEDFYNRSAGSRQTALEGIILPFTGKGKIVAKQAKVMGFDIESFQTDALLKSDAILLKSKFVSNNGNVVSNFIYSGESEDASLWRLSVDASNVEIGSLLKQAGAEEKILTGDADIKIELSARRGKEMPSKRIDGKGEVYSKNGRLWKFIVLSKIFSIVNIISIDELFRDGLPYKTVAGNFTVKNGVISTDNLLLDSNSMRMSAIGIIDTTNMTIDAKLGLHPFVSVDKIITNIPLAGWIIGGKEKSIISMYYEIKGPLKNPEVEAIPIKALGEGVWGIFKRTLKLPLDIVEPLVK